MESDSPSQRKAQLDKAERAFLEDVVEDLRERCENNVRYQLTRKGLDSEPDAPDALDEDVQQLVEAIELEAVDGHEWDEALEGYVTGVGYTIVNRLAALRCMEVRGFVDEEVTVFKANGLTPAAETLVHEAFLLEDEAIVQAYHDACDELAEEIEILFDRSTAYSLIDPDQDAFSDLCTSLDEVPDEVWRADDVLGWVYEYYNRPTVEALDAKNTLEPKDVGPANQFYTPHWVVRMLTDNSLGKLYLEATGKESALSAVEDFSVAERKNRQVTPEDAPDVPTLCTYLIPDDEEGEAPSFDDPSELRVIDPACGSGHFLLYAFDVLERVWWAERPDVDRAEVPAKILEHNLYGVDIDLRSCQLSAFNLYLKARTRAAEESSAEFAMPNVGIVCADARIAEVESAVEVFDEIAADRPAVRESLGEVMEQFQNIEALGSLLDVEGAISEEFLREQTSILDSFDGPHTLNAFLTELREAVESRTSDSFVAQNLRSFMRLLVILTQEYDVALMNPPYGARGRMPNGVQEYVDDHYDYTTEYYINFFEACDRLVTENGRTGMLVPWSFMFNKSFQDFREDFIGGRGSFDFFAEFGYDILDNATVGTVGTVVRSEAEGGQTGTFIRLPDVPKAEKEQLFVRSAFANSVEEEVKRRYEREISEFGIVPGAPLSYWVPVGLRQMYDSSVVLDSDNAGLDRESLGSIKVGLQTGNDSRFIRNFWEQTGRGWFPVGKGGSDTWLLPRVKEVVNWTNSGQEVIRYSGSYPRNSDYYFQQGLTFNRVKRSGRRFGHLHSGSVFGDKGPTIFSDRHSWNLLSYANSHLFTYLMLTQTSERMWEVGFVSKVPWREELEGIDELERLSQEAVGHLIAKRQHDFVSPHYNGPVLLAALGIAESLAQYDDHPHRDLRDELTIDTVDETASPDDSLSAIGTAAAKHLERIEANLQSCADAIDEAVFECFEITDDQRETILQEIALRTTEDPREREEYDPESITEPTDEFPAMVKDLLCHLTLRIVHADDDGVVPISAVESEADLLTRIEGEFERLFGEHASDRLAEVDQVLGSRTADQEAYPNLRAWLENDLFAYHVATFDRTPILWRLTTERLVSDPEGEGFACLVDYHGLDSGMFDRLQTRYLEPRKALLRERRSAANRRQGDDSLPTSERAAAAAQHDRCESGLEQIEAFEDRVGELARPSPRDWPSENQQVARDTIETVAAFREETRKRLAMLDELAALDDVDMGDLFSPSFYDTVEKNREEWLSAVEDLETAFEAYAADGSEPVEAHLYDLFAYFDDLAGSDHYASNGILFTTYYFEKFESPDQASLNDGEVSERQRLVGELARGLDSYKELAAEIREACDDVASDISSDWADRALAEITTAGYQPNHKHGVAINVTPLADAEIVPKIVERKVL